MASVVRDAQGLLADAEKALRDLMQREINAQRYADLAALAVMADGLARLARGDQSRNINASHFRDELPSTSVAAAAPPIDQVHVSSNRTRSRYPRFERDGDKLIKIGWSKKSREEYEHRASRAAVEVFAQHLLTRIDPGKTFAVEDLLPVPDNTGEDLPSYQVYLILAWLCLSGMIAKKGRDGYVVSDRLNHDGSLEALWKKLPQRNA